MTRVLAMFHRKKKSIVQVVLLLLFLADFLGIVLFWACRLEFFFNVFSFTMLLLLLLLLLLSPFSQIEHSDGDNDDDGTLWSVVAIMRM